MEQRLNERRSAGNYRILKQESALLDFCSNDYLGFARSTVLKSKIEEEITQNRNAPNGATGSRLISGNSAYAEELEKHIAGFHGSEAGLIFNSGYDANIGLFSSLPQRGDTIITDELIHASIIDGTRLSYANRYIFKHNDVNSLEEKLKHAKGNIYVVIESVYSMDGDSPPMTEILDLTEKYKASLIVDEAHAIGPYKSGLITAALNERIFAKVVTFGKALGGHGAIVLGSSLLREYLINFARSFIYTTALPFHQLAAIKMSYELLNHSDPEIMALNGNIDLFRTNFIPHEAYPLVESRSAIQCIILKSNEKAKDVAFQLQQNSFDVRAILSPTVARGSERIRICLHSFNHKEHILSLTKNLNNYINGL